MIMVLEVVEESGAIVIFEAYLGGSHNILSNNRGYTWRSNICI